MVRTFPTGCFRPPWPFVRNNCHGIRKIGPIMQEAHKWPGQKNEFTDLNPDYKGPGKKTPDRGASMDVNAMWGFTRPYPVGYSNPSTGEFVNVREMIPELVVPDLTDFGLGPYVSFRTDAEIENRRRKYEELVAKEGSEEEANKATNPDDRWPPPRMDAKTLFDLFYAEKVQKTYLRRIKEGVGKKGDAKPDGVLT